MQTTKERAAAVKPVKIDGVVAAIPRGLSADEEAEVIAQVREHINTDPDFLARKERAEADAAKMRAKLAAAQQRRLEEAQRAALNGGDNPNG